MKKLITSHFISTFIIVVGIATLIGLVSDIEQRLNKICKRLSEIM